MIGDIGKPLLTKEKVCEFLGCSVRTLYRLIAENELVALKVRGGLRITAESVEMYCRRQILRYIEEDG